jgi:hypothetical protein
MSPVAESAASLASAEMLNDLGVTWSGASRVARPSFDMAGFGDGDSPGTVTEFDLGGWFDTDHVDILACLMSS